eukprot:gb/GEZN01012765.1/.p1 GENE.gb/GEZN01012765.1/~~gb/GEZN01012765.1/.p1  ORF type:complete len:173 (+),score=4.46 gb/GEZN01012765.1/:474-992(+)
MSHPDGQRWYGEEVGRAVREGHELGDHGTVDERHASLDPRVFTARFLQCKEYIESVQRECGLGPPGSQQKWFRPGGGFWNEQILQTVQTHGYQTVLGNIYNCVEPYTSRNQFLWWLTVPYLVLRARTGGIIVLHDRTYTPEVLRCVLPHIVSRFDVVTLSELLNHPMAEPQS